MKVGQIMTHEAESCTTESDLAHVAMVMSRRSCGLVPVLDPRSARVVGVLTDRDICMAVATRHADAHSIRAGEVMTRRVAFCAPGDDVRIAMRRMEQARVRRLPVVNSSGDLVGILSLTDLALAAERHARNGEPAIPDADLVTVLRAVSEYPSGVGHLVPA
jgi:CBS domain-containing protein